MAFSSSFNDTQLMADSCQVMLNVLFGSDNWERWNNVKEQSPCGDLQPFVAWLLDIAEIEITKPSQSATDVGANSDGLYDLNEVMSTGDDGPMCTNNEVEPDAAALLSVRGGGGCSRVGEYVGNEAATCPPPSTSYSCGGSGIKQESGGSAVDGTVDGVCQSSASAPTQMEQQYTGAPCYEAGQHCPTGGADRDMDAARANIKPQQNNAFDEDILVAYDVNYSKEVLATAQQTPAVATHSKRNENDTMPDTVVDQHAAANTVSLYCYRNLKKFRCDECMVLLNDTVVIKDHLEMRHRGCPVMITCECCLCRYSSVDQLLLKHKQMPRYYSYRMGNACTYCDKRCASKQALIDHVKNIHENAAASYQCQFCAKKFKYACNLTTHKKKCARFD